MSPNEHWTEKAACKDKPPEWFFPERGDQAATAKAICAGCPVSTECGDYALRTSQRHGIWGGMAYNELRRVRTVRTIQCKHCLEWFDVRADRVPPPLMCSPECRLEAKRLSSRRSHARTG
jgi:WhiB family redox-sensing transcriptional regulator